MNRFCIITNRGKDEGLVFTDGLVSYIRKKGGSCKVLDGSLGADGAYTDPAGIPEDVQCAIVLGGDGTIIRAATDLADRAVPIFGINLGTLGFLAETEKQDAFRAIDLLFEDEIRIEERMMLDSEIYFEEQKLFEGRALNDVVVTRSGYSRLICAEVYVNGELLNEYRGDGVIVATPTGSTGYNLSAGGPIVMPGAKLMLVTPICPHSINNREIAISAEDEVTILVKESKKTLEEGAFATLDGKDAIRLKTGERIVIRRSDRTAKLVRRKDRSFFDILRTKL